MITGARESAESAVRAGMTHILFSVRPEEEAKAVDAYLKSLKPVSSPYPKPRGGRDASPDAGRESGQPEEAGRGWKVFEKAGCIACHPPPLFTDLKKYDLGLGKDLDRDRAFDTPSLVEIWRTAPYLYDGRAATIRDVLVEHNEKDLHGRTSDLTPKEIADLEAFILSL
jgi:cytochrome c peroxidase